MSLRILTFILAAVMAIGAAASSPAQVATPSVESLFASLGLPEITLMATDEGLTLSQKKVPAGRYLVTLDNQSGDPEQYVEIVRLMEEVDIDTSCPTLFPPECLPWYFATYIPGGVSDQSPQAVIELPAGEYGLWGPWAESVEPEAILTVTGDSATAIDGPEPEAAAVTVTKGDDGYGFALHVAGELQPGLQIVKIVNAANQPLCIAATQNPARFIVDQAAGTPVFDAFAGDSPPFDVRDGTQFWRVTSTHAQSANSTQWVAMDLTLGDVYVAAYIPDPRNGEDVVYPWFAATAIVVPVTEP